MKSAIESFIDGELSVNEFAVLVALQGKGTPTISTSTTEISENLRGDLSRHAVARALRNLQRDKWLTWKTGTGRLSTITVY